MSRKPGKRIDHITLNVDGSYYKVELRVSTSMYNEEFYLCMENPKIEISGTDLADLKSKMTDFIRTNFVTKWETWLKISVNDPRYCESPGSEHYQVEIFWRRFEQGVTTQGEKMSRDVGSKHSSHGWASDGKCSDGTTCVRETPEIVAALEEIGRRIEEIRCKLTTMLAPKQIELMASNFMEFVKRALPAPVKGEGNH